MKDILNWLVSAPKAEVKDEFGNPFTTAEPEKWEKGRFDGKWLQKIEKNSFGIWERKPEFIRFFGNLPDYLTYV